MVNVPPLLSSTPPPIDFGEDDDSGLQSTLNLDDGDEYSDFGLVSITNEPALNAKAPSLPRLMPQLELPISDFNSPPPDLDNGFIRPPTNVDNKTAPVARQTVEAFNFQVTGAKPSQDYDNYAPPTPPPLADDINEVEHESAEEEDPNTNDNVPSLKLDSLSLYSSESVSASSTLSPAAHEPPAVEPTAKAHVLCHQVTLEDVSDDSDEECSPKKPKELFISEGAEDFFAIEIVGSPTLENVTARPKANTPPATELETSCDKQNEPPEFNAFQNTEADLVNQSMPMVENVEHLDEDDDFGDFADFSAAQTMPSSIEQSQSQLAADKDDGFDDFQDFESTTAIATTLHNDDDDDDDFGDFEAPASIAVPPPPPPAVTHLSITERVKPVLELMFPTQDNNAAAATGHTHAPMPVAPAQPLHFGAIEQAHALDYQWSGSEMRHALVRSLAIDSRNILFGDKWNANMPRFAANLSFDPLQPLKPLGPAAVCATTPPPPAADKQSTSQPQMLEGLDAAATQTCQAEAQSGPAHGQNAPGSSSGSSSSSGGGHDDDDEEEASGGSGDDINAGNDAAAAAPAFAAAAATASLPIAVSADGNGYRFDGGEQQHQQHLDLRPTGVGATSQPSGLLEDLVATSGYAVPLKETHIYTPSKSDTAVAKTTTLSPVVDFDYEMAAAGIIIDETVVKKEYRDVEYKPPPFPLGDGGSFALPKPAKAKPAEDDDFTDFQSMPAPTTTQQLKATLQPPRNGTPTFGEQMILSPAILLPQTMPLAKHSIEWGESALTNINAEELARIEELFPQAPPAPLQQQQRLPQAPSISATLTQQPQQQPGGEDEDWSDFVSVPVQQPNHNNNNNVGAPKRQQLGTPLRQLPPTATKDDDWSDFVSSTPPLPAAPQFNSGAWQSANFYNNPLSLYQQQHHHQKATHSNLVPKYQGYNNNHSSSSNNNNALTPQQIHIMHDFSTAPANATAATTATYQQQHHQHHQQQQQQLQLQQRQQFQIGNAKVAPRISLIPDLSFVAPALPTNAGAFMSSLPKPSFGAKK